MTIQNDDAKTKFPLVAAARVRMLVLDVDGVLSDGRVTLMDSAEQIKSFNVRDGHGIKMLQRAGVQVAILTGRRSLVVEHRAKELGIVHVIQGSLDKASGMAALCEAASVAWSDCAYMGDDVVDLPAMRGCALSTAPKDAHQGVLGVVDWVSSANGGQGAVRELAEGLILASGQWPTVMQERYGLTPAACGW